MEPSESEVYPDIMLAFDSNRADEYIDILTELNRGDAFGFNATLMSLGSSSMTRHFHVEAIWKEEGHIEVAPHIHETGRYNDNIKFLGHALTFEDQLKKEMEEK